MVHGELIDRRKIKRIGALGVQGLETLRLVLGEKFGEEVHWIHYNVGLGNVRDALFDRGKVAGRLFVKVYIDALFFPIGIEKPDRPYKRTTPYTPGVGADVLMISSDNGATWTPAMVNVMLSGIQLGDVCWFEQDLPGTSPLKEIAALFNKFRPVPQSPSRLEPFSVPDEL